MRGSVLLAFLDVLPGPVGRHDALEGRLEVARDGRVGMLVDRHPGRRMRDVDEHGRAALPVDGVLHEPCDVDQLALPLGLKPELDHGRV